MNFRLALTSVALLLSFPALARSVPITVDGDPFALVATGPGTAQLFVLTSDAQGRIYVGNNSNTTSGIPLQRFDPALYSGSTIALASFGPAVGDADGVTFGGGALFSGDRNEGVRRTDVPAATSAVFVAGKGINETGSPVVYRPSDGHLFIGFGATAGGTAVGDERIDEHNASGAFVQTFTTLKETETMTINPATGLIYYANFSFTGPSEIHSFDPLTSTDNLIGFASGTVDGGLAFDPLSGLLFLGTANGTNPGFVETMNPTTGATTLFATGFTASLGILREPVSGDLYFLDQNQLYRLESDLVFDVPEPSTFVLAALGLLGLGFVALRNKYRPA